MADSLSHHPRKRFGQNFLTDTAVIDKIIEFINPKKDEIIIEIGPGLGALTQPLLNSECQLTAIELDRDLAQHLKAHYPALTLVCQDALKTDFTKLIDKENKAKIVGNLPYNISTPLIFHLLQFENYCSSMYFMLQKEVVDRMSANPNTKDYGRLSIMVQYHCDVRPLLHIPPQAFKPPPKIDSTFVQLTPRRFALQADNFNLLEKVVSAAFNHRRKTLRNCLKSIWPEKSLTGLPKQWLDKRPENLPIEDFVQLCNLINQSIH